MRPKAFDTNTAIAESKNGFQADPLSIISFCLPRRLHLDSTFFGICGYLREACIICASKNTVGSLRTDGFCLLPPKWRSNNFFAFDIEVGEKENGCERFNRDE